MRELIGHCKIAMAETKGNLIEGVDPVDQRGTGAQRDQRIHIRRAVQQCFETYTVVFIVDDGHRQHQDEEGQRIDHRIFRTKEKSRQRPAHHVSHGNIKQRDCKDKGPDHPALHRFIFFFGGVYRRSCGLAAFSPFCILQRGAIAGFFDSADDDAAVKRRVVVVDDHAVFQQVDRAVVDAGQLRHAFLHTR